MICVVVPICCCCCYCCFCNQLVLSALSHRSGASLPGENCWKTSLLSIAEILGKLQSVFHARMHRRKSSKGRRRGCVVVPSKTKSQHVISAALPSEAYLVRNTSP
uniref:Putative secreted protein n=1 Tax=Anopheles triannulatus TaxID=58253 RepID=A0A2M4B6A1_9DIPT